MKVDVPNIPHNFDSTNLHHHGLNIEVHMFDPVGTHNPEAPHIVVGPGECYC
jgi:suppressor of ftsI